MKPAIGQTWRSKTANLTYKITNFYPASSQPDKIEKWNYKTREKGKWIYCDNMIETEEEINSHFDFIGA